MHKPVKLMMTMIIVIKIVMMMVMVMMMVTMMVMMMVIMVMMVMMMMMKTFPSLPSFWLVASICQSVKLKLDNRTSPDGRLGGKSYCKLRLKQLWSG